MLNIARLMASAAVCALMLTQFAAAQDERALGIGQQPRTGGEKMNVDSKLATCLLIDNQGEISLAQFAKTKTTNQEVESFAQMMIDDHTDFVKKLHAFLPEAKRSATDKENARTAIQPERTAKAAGHFDFLAIKREIADQSEASLKRELGQREGADFDTCFAGQQIMSHVHMLDTLTVFKKHASPELAELIDEGMQTTKEHLSHAKQLAKQLEGTPRTARK